MTTNIVITKVRSPMPQSKKKTRIEMGITWLEWVGIGWCIKLGFELHEALHSLLKLLVHQY